MPKFSVGFKRTAAFPQSETIRCANIVRGQKPKSPRAFRASGSQHGLEY